MVVNNKTKYLYIDTVVLGSAFKAETFSVKSSFARCNDRFEDEHLKPIHFSTFYHRPVLLDSQFVVDRHNVHFKLRHFWYQFCHFAGDNSQRESTARTALLLHKFYSGESFARNLFSTTDGDYVYDE